MFFSIQMTKDRCSITTICTWRQRQQFILQIFGLETELVRRFQISNPMLSLFGRQDHRASEILEIVTIQVKTELY